MLEVSCQALLLSLYAAGFHIKSEETHPGYLSHDIVEKDSLEKNAISILAGVLENVSCQMRVSLKQYRA